MIYFIFIALNTFVETDTFLFYNFEAKARFNLL